MPWLAVKSAARLGPLAALMLLSGCVQTRWEAPPPRVYDSAPATEERSERGNPPFYEVFGRRYYVMDASTGYKERGVASWYGKKFHGRRTSSGEIYDMHAMTAAHKTLPLPTRVRVTNLRNGRSVVVRVNDRGPFVDDRIIDLSYTAAQQLGMVRAGTAMVEVTALPEVVPADPAPFTTVAAAEQAPDASAQGESVPRPRPAATRVYLQVGAFGDRSNADQMRSELLANGFGNAIIHYDAGDSPALYRVRLGPIENVAEYDSLMRRVAALHLGDTHLVTEQSGTNIVTEDASGI